MKIEKSIFYDLINLVELAFENSRDYTHGTHVRETPEYYKYLTLDINRANRGSLLKTNYFRSKIKLLNSLQYYITINDDVIQYLLNYVVLRQPFIDNFFDDEFEDELTEDGLLKLLEEKNSESIPSKPKIKAEKQLSLFKFHENSGSANKQINPSNTQDFRKKLIKTSKRRYSDSRIGHGKYRKKVLARWGHKCAVTGCNIKELLRASHIKPWKISSPFERVDVENGLCLSPLWDALFDKRLISFTESGELVVSPKINVKSLRVLGIKGDEKIQGLSDGNINYLSYHRSTTMSTFF